MKKLIIFILLATVLLSGCSANNTSNQQTTSSEKTKQTIAYKSLESKSQTTTEASKYWQKFIKEFFWKVISYI